MAMIPTGQDAIGLGSACSRCGNTEPDVRHCCHRHHYVICSTCWVGSDPETHEARP